MPVTAAAILPADLGFGPDFLALAFALVGLLFFVFLFSVIRSTKHPDEAKRYGFSKHERTYAIIFLIVALIFATSTLGLLPNPYEHSNIHQA